MNSNTFRLAALAVAAAPVALLAAVPAQAATATTVTGDGKASAVVLRTALDVSLVNKTINVPLKATLNEVQAPASAEKTALSVELDGVDGGNPFSLLKADVATAEATVDEHRAEGRSNLAKATVHVPGLPALSLIEVEKVTSSAVCEVGKTPVAESNVLGHVSVLGKKITLTAGGTTRVDVPAVGEVTLDLSKTSTTSRTAAAVALQLKVSVNPLDLNVAEVNGEVTLAEATCETPKTPEEPGGTDGGSGNGGATGGSSDGATGGSSGGEVKPQTGSDPAPAAEEPNLAETGGSSTTPYIAGGAALLLAVGAAATVVARRRTQG